MFHLPLPALQSLTKRVNLSTGLGHPSDRSSAISMFKLLKRAGYSWEPDAVKIWAIQNGWKADHAADLADKAQGVLEGRRYQNVTDMWATDILAQWSAEAD